MSYVKILIVGIYWLISTICSLQGLLNIALAILSIFIPKLREYALEQWIADDRRVNSFFNGKSRNTISSRVGFKSRTDKRYIGAKKVVNALFYLFERNHCENEAKSHVE